MEQEGGILKKHGHNELKKIIKHCNYTIILQKPVDM